MGQTITEKILARAAGRSRVAPGEYLTVRSNCPIVFGHHSFDTFMDRGLHMITRLGVHVFDPAKVIIVDGHGGDLMLETTDTGASFLIRLPIHDA